MTLPLATLDHVVINARDRLDEAQAQYLRLGFTLTPRGYHSLGSINHLAIFGTEYLELLAIPPGSTKRADVLDYPAGLHGLVFGTADSAAAYAAVKEAGVPIGAPMEFTRPVELEGGARDATFRTATLVPGTIPAGRIFFCHHFTRDLVWRDEWRHHANGTVGVIRAIIAAEAPDQPGAIFSKMFGSDALRPIRHGERLIVGLSAFDIVTPNEVAVQFGDAAPGGDGRPQYMAGLTLRTRSLAMTRAALKAGGVEGVHDDGDRLVVPAAQATGTVLEFRE